MSSSDNDYGSGPCADGSDCVDGYCADGTPCLGTNSGDNNLPNECADGSDCVDGYCADGTPCIQKIISSLRSNPDSPPSNTDLINAFVSHMTMRRTMIYDSGYSEQIDYLNEEINDMNGQLDVLDGQEETYNEMYKNARMNPVNYGLFSKLGLRTTQDWVLAYFYFSYVVFSVLLLLVFVKISQNKLVAAIFVFGLCLSMGVISTMGIISYG